MRYYWYTHDTSACCLFVAEPSDRYPIPDKHHPNRPSLHSVEKNRIATASVLKPPRGSNSQMEVQLYMSQVPRRLTLRFVMREGSVGIVLPGRLRLPWVAAQGRVPPRRDLLRIRHPRTAHTGRRWL